MTGVPLPSGPQAAGGRPAPAPAWPGSRTILAWWREVEDLRPRRLWISQLRVHRVEALVQVARPVALDAFSCALLAHLASDDLVPLAVLSAATGLERQLLRQWLADLAASGLASQASGGWTLTDAGRLALGQGAAAEAALERMSFPFLDRGDAGLPPHYVPLGETEEAQAAEGWPFDVSVLVECIGRPEPWQARYRFPSEVAEVLLPQADPTDWRRVVLDYPSVVTAVLVERPGDGATALSAFGVGVPGWALRRGKAILELGEGWEQVFPDLAGGLPAEAWAQAWQAWCQPRGLPRAEVEACRVTAEGTQVSVQAPARLVERLRASQSDAVRHEAWLLAGTGRSRAAGRIELRERS